MAHELFGERFYGKRELAWHGLGQVFEHEPTAVEAFQEAGLNYHVGKHPLFAYINGNYEIIEDQFALVREATEDDPQNRMFGVVSNQYQVLNNMDIAPIVDLLSKEWPIETVGALKDGRTIFVTLKADLAEVAGEELAKYFLLTDTKDGKGGAMRLAFTPIRVVCTNTLTTAISGARDQFSLSHTGDLQADLNGAVEIIAASKRAEKDVLETFRYMAQFKAEVAQLQTLLDAAYPLPKVGRWERFKDDLEDLDVSKAVTERVLQQHEKLEARRQVRQRLQEGAKELYQKFCDEHTDLAQTPWAMYNAIVEFEDFRNGWSGREGESLLFGQRAERKAKAFTAAVKVMRGS